MLWSVLIAGVDALLLGRAELGSVTFVRVPLPPSAVSFPPSMAARNIFSLFGCLEGREGGFVLTAGVWWRLSHFRCPTLGRFDRAGCF